MFWEHKLEHGESEHVVVSLEVSISLSPKGSVHIKRTVTSQKEYSSCAGQQGMVQMLLNSTKGAKGVSPQFLICNKRPAS